MVRSVLTDNHVSPGSSTGGGIDAFGSLTIVDSTVSANSSSGPAGGAAAGDTVNVTRSSIDHNIGNTSGGTVTGGGIYTFDADVNVTDSTISGNTSPGGDGGGGGIASGSGLNGGTVTVVNSTVTGNSVTNGTGGGIVAPEIVLAYATVTDNTALDPANLDFLGLTSFASVVAQPVGGGNCNPSGSVTSDGRNFADDDTCDFVNVAAGDRQGAGLDPLLAALATNGGPRRRVSHSPAVR